MADELNLENILVAVVVAYVLWLIYNEHLRWNLPPGPWGLPLIGHLPFLGAHPHATFHQMRQIYGDIFRIRLGSFPTVVINGELVKEAANNNHFDGRPAFYSVVNNLDTLAFTLYSDAWKKQKKLTVSVLHEFVSERRSILEELLSEEVEGLINDFSAQAGNPFNPKMTIYKATCGLTYKLCYGREKNLREDEGFIELLEEIQRFVDFVDAGNPVDVLPWLRFFVPWKVTQFKTYIEKFYSNGLKKIAEHEEHFDKDNIRDITDRFLSIDYSRSDFAKAGLTKQRALVGVETLVGASVDTLGTVIRWFLLLMVKYPEIQQRIFKEIEELTGGNRQVTIADRKSLQYTEATIFETLRIRTPIPILLPHSTLCDTRIGRFDIPKGTVIVLNAYSLAMDESTWDDPEIFRPERFLNEAGDVDINKTAKITPFGLGMRKCPGDSLARLELFVILANLLQNFVILPVEGAEYDLVSVHGLTDYPKPFEIIAHSRNA